MGALLGKADLKEGPGPSHARVERSRGGGQGGQRQAQLRAVGITALPRVYRGTVFLATR
jgi:hypothetical protein